MLAGRKEPHKIHCNLAGRTGMDKFRSWNASMPYTLSLSLSRAECVCLVVGVFLYTFDFAEEFDSWKRTYQPAGTDTRNGSRVVRSVDEMAEIATWWVGYCNSRISCLPFKCRANKVRKISMELIFIWHTGVAAMREFIFAIIATFSIGSLVEFSVSFKVILEAFSLVQCYHGIIWALIIQVCIFRCPPIFYIDSYGNDNAHAII